MERYYAPKDGSVCPSARPIDKSKYRDNNVNHGYRNQTVDPLQNEFWDKYHIVFSKLSTFDKTLCPCRDKKRCSEYLEACKEYYDTFEQTEKFYLNNKIGDPNRRRAAFRMLLPVLGQILTCMARNIAHNHSKVTCYYQLSY